MNLHELNEKVNQHTRRKRPGRGPGSGMGTTAGRGQDGARARSGFKNKLYMDGGQMTFIRRIPKRGFTNTVFRREWSFVNLKDLNAFADGDVVTPEECLKRGIIPKMRSGLKVLGVGKLREGLKLTVKAHRASASAKKAIEESGGTLELMPTPGDQAKARWLAKRGEGRTTRRRRAAAKKSREAGG